MTPHRLGYTTLGSQRQRPASAGTHRSPTIRAQAEASTGVDLYERDADGRIVDYRPEVHAYGRPAVIGDWYVFAGDWLTRHDDEHGVGRARVGYTGQLTSLFDGWAAFHATGDVVAVLVADHDADRARFRNRYTRDGLTPARVEAEVDLFRCRLTFDGQVLVWDDRAGAADDTCIAEIRPSRDGLYDLTALDWCWEPCHPAICDRVVGDPPPAVDLM
ncbi:hypothetical protein Lfu02_77160 [Longispora fulva]|uniref:Uncharacterized protein n=1 Tax=Longispora fulva TaxID=619741 RepID=A0A8J7GE29_9ACTN|nr:hypothetical protein [Longispora fulva]MBG6136165.1 hypothetical protein [Longispora fulva]GIG63344.1 hypothetical protein Lfu02_77160 [Longispora fulva]